MSENWSAKTDPQPEAAMPQLMDAKDVAKILKIAPKTVHKLVRRGKLGCVQVTAKERRFTEEQMREYIESRTIERPVDRKSPKPVDFPRKGGKKSFGCSRTSLREEMRSWR